MTSHCITSPCLGLLIRMLQPLPLQCRWCYSAILEPLLIFPYTDSTSASGFHWSDCTDLLTFSSWCCCVLSIYRCILLSRIWATVYSNVPYCPQSDPFNFLNCASFLIFLWECCPFLSLYTIHNSILLQLPFLPIYSFHTCCLKSLSSPSSSTCITFLLVKLLHLQAAGFMSIL